MHRNAVFLTPILFSFVINAQPMSQQRRATLVGGSSDRGKCTIEVVVDDVAEVAIRGDMATLTTLAGRPAEWRRFQCNGPLPSNPADFRFAGVDGRGRQDLVRDPRQGGAAVIRIEDKQGGSEGYTFDIFWSGGNGGGGFGGPGPGYRPGGGRWGRDEAVRGCQDAIRDQAAQRYRGPVDFLDGRIDDNPGRNDWVVGRIRVGRDTMNYSCSVDFQSGRVRSASIEGGGPSRPRYDTARAIDGCQRSAEDRLRRDGYRRTEFTNVRVDDNPGRNDWIVGSVRAYRGPNFETFDVSCSVNLNNGDIRSVDVRRR